jgi:hypothetical protein
VTRAVPLNLRMSTISVYGRHGCAVHDTQIAGRSTGAQQTLNMRGNCSMQWPRVHITARLCSKSVRNVKVVVFKQTCTPHSHCRAAACCAPEEDEQLELVPLCCTQPEHLCGWVAIKGQIRMQ